MKRSTRIRNKALRALGVTWVLVMLAITAGSLGWSLWLDAMVPPSLLLGAVAAWAAVWALLHGCDACALLRAAANEQEWEQKWKRGETLESRLGMKL